MTTHHSELATGLMRSDLNTIANYIRRTVLLPRFTTISCRSPCRPRKTDNRLAVSASMFAPFSKHAPLWATERSQSGIDNPTT